MKNNVQLIGNLGATPEVKEINGKSKVARVALATNERYKNAKGEYVTETTWHNLVLWGAQAETASRLMKKGAEVAIQGKIVNRNYEDKSGAKRYVSEIRVDEFLIISRNTDKQ